MRSPRVCSSKDQRGRVRPLRRTAFKIIPRRNSRIFYSMKEHRWTISWIKLKWPLFESRIRRKSNCRHSCRMEGYRPRHSTENQEIWRNGCLERKKRLARSARRCKIHAQKLELSSVSLTKTNNLCWMASVVHPIHREVSKGRHHRPQPLRTLRTINCLKSSCKK